MFLPVRTNSFLRDFFVIQAGFACFGFSIALTIRANLGTATWSVFEVALAEITRLSVGTVTILVGFSVLVVAVLMRQKIGWGTLANILSIGPWLDLFLWLIPSSAENLLLQSGMLLSGVFTQGIASAIYIGVDAGAGPRDSLMLAIQRSSGMSLRLARGTIEIGVFGLGWALGGPAGLGTLVFALLIGPAVHWGYKVFNIPAHSKTDLG